MLEYVMAIYLAQRLRLLADHSAYVIAGADRGQLSFCCGTGLYGRVRKKDHIPRNSVALVVVVDVGAAGIIGVGVVVIPLVADFCFVCLGTSLYMQVATSIFVLIKKTIDDLLQEHAPKTLVEARIQVPSLTWVCLQFCVKNPLSASALNYTGAQKLAHKVQQYRTLRATSIDSHYVAGA